MDYRQLIQRLTPDIYDSLKRAVETGRWPDGRALTADQRQEALQAIIAWGALHLPEDQRVGFVDSRHKGGQRCDEPQETPLNWQGSQ